MSESPIVQYLTDVARAMKAANEAARTARQQAAIYREALLAVLADIEEDPDKVRGITIKTIEIVRKAVES